MRLSGMLPWDTFRAARTDRETHELSNTLVDLFEKHAVPDAVVDELLETLEAGTVARNGRAAAV
jgi:hypothetical protein